MEFHLFQFNWELFDFFGEDLWVEVGEGGSERGRG